MDTLYVVSIMQQTVSCSVFHRIIYQERFVIQYELIKK